MRQPYSCAIHPPASTPIAPPTETPTAISENTVARFSGVKRSAIIDTTGGVKPASPIPTPMRASSRCA